MNRRNKASIQTLFHYLYSPQSWTPKQESHSNEPPSTSLTASRRPFPQSPHPPGFFTAQNQRQPTNIRTQPPTQQIPQPPRKSITSKASPGSALRYEAVGGLAAKGGKDSEAERPPMTPSGLSKYLSSPSVPSALAAPQTLWLPQPPSTPTAPQAATVRSTEAKSYLRNPLCQLSDPDSGVLSPDNPDSRKW